MSLDQELIGIIKEYDSRIENLEASVHALYVREQWRNGKTHNFHCDCPVGEEFPKCMFCGNVQDHAIHKLPSTCGTVSETVKSS